MGDKGKSYINSEDFFELEEMGEEVLLEELCEELCRVNVNEDVMPEPRNKDNVDHDEKKIIHC